MNNDKIGKFIAKLRKDKKMTQLELANKLHVTDRAVSHWENGRRLPDISLFQSICEIFDISVSELISGEKIAKDKIIKKSDENIIHTLNTNKKNKKDFIRIIIMLFISILVLIIILFFVIRNLYPKIDIQHFTILLSDPDEPYTLKREFKYYNQNVYYYGIDSAVFCDKEKCYQVKEAFKNNQITLENFQNYLEKQAEYENVEIMKLFDGGTTIYKKKGFLVMYCNTVDGNKDVYIGNSEMLNNLNGEYCGHSKNLEESYIRTYKIIASVINKDDDEFNDVTLEQNNGYRETVLINNSYSLIPGRTYEFSFLTFDYFDDTIENIFNNSTLLRVVETDKILLEQINDKIIVNNTLNNDVELNELDHVVMNIVDGTLTNSSVRIRITDFSGNKYIFGQDYRIDRMENDKWVELEEKNNLYTNSIGYGPDENGHIELDINWDYVYGKLSAGRYRIVKTALLNSNNSCENECKQYFISAEFDIN